MKLPIVETPLQVRFADIDQLGHVSNNVYLQYFDMGRLTFFQAIEDRPIPYTVVVRIEMDLIREIKMTDVVTLKTWCSHVGTKSMRMEQHLFANGECAAQGHLVLAGFDMDKRQSAALPSHWQPSNLIDDTDD
ncbi:Uncharacterised protein [BD1-7 clade bacterium]|uniref:Uncharacterized protein n=1 Tax=BD1-7 clade bacterium TaxID=2029982 RepID=A0A5S9PA43_9GAMM|nr:Uncharacterised protein [BD1-7 clade bacterium]